MSRGFAAPVPWRQAWYAGAISLMVMVAVSAMAVPAEGADSGAADRLAELQKSTPDDDPDAYIGLAGEVLNDLAQHPSTQVEATVRTGLGRALRLSGRFGEAIPELAAAVRLAERVGRTDLLQAGLADLARCHFYLGDFEAAVTTCRRALDRPEIGDDPDRAWRFVNILAACQLQLGQFDEAIATSAAALDDRQRVGDRDAEATLLNNIGVAHMYLGDYDSALEFFQRARLIKTELGETVGVADILANIGDIHQLQGRLDEAIDVHDKALAMRRLEGDDLRIAQSQRSLAASLHAAGRDLEALDQISSAIELVRQADAKPELVTCLAVQGEVLAALGRTDDAIASATESLELARRLEMTSSQIAALDALVEAWAAAGRPERALEFQTQVRELERDLTRADIRSRFAQFQAEHDARQKQREIELLRSGEERRSAELEGLRRWRNALLGALALVAALAAVGWYRVVADRRHERSSHLELKMLEDELIRARRQVGASPAGLFQTDLDGTILTANRAFATMLGRPGPESLIGVPLLGLAADSAAVHDLLGDLAVSRAARTRDLDMLDADGELVSVLVAAARIEDGEREVVSGIAMDISERNRLERDRRRIELDLQQSQKLESLGVLAGGIAHDFNNMLMAILSNISLAKRSAASDETVHRLAEAEEVCLRATTLTQQLLTFSKGGRPIRAVASIGRLVEEATVDAARGGNCHYDCRFNPELWSVEADQGQLAQVVQNLVVNAIEAMPRGGTVTVTADNAHLVEGDVPTLDAGRFVRIDVTDTGAGIPDGHLETVFDPFFTTKKGQSGLGLATAFSIVRSHGGAIVVHSEEDRGTTMTVYLPAVDTDPTAASPPDDGPVRGHGRLLIMDDDEAVRSAAAELLETIGYDVVTAADGAEALELYRAAIDDDHRFDAVVLDLTVPEGVGGRETMSRLLAIDPDVKAIVSSGYSTDPVMANYRDHGFSGVAVKPYRLAELARTLHRIMESIDRP